MRRMLDLVSGLVIARSMARALPCSQLTSPGRRPEVGPRMPFFSITGFRRPSSAMLFTRFRSVLCLVIKSPHFAASGVVAIDVDGLLARRNGVALLNTGTPSRYL